MLERLGKGCGEWGTLAQSDRKDTGMQEELGVEAQKDMPGKPCTLCSTPSPSTKACQKPAQTRGESHVTVTGAGFYNKLVWILAHRTAESHQRQDSDQNLRRW